MGLFALLIAIYIAFQIIKGVFTWEFVAFAVLMYIIFKNLNT